MFECLAFLIGPGKQLGIKFKFRMRSYCGASAEVTGAGVIMVFLPYPKYPYFLVTRGDFFSLK